MLGRVFSVRLNFVTTHLSGLKDIPRTTTRVQSTSVSRVRTKSRQEGVEKNAVDKSIIMNQRDI